MNRPAKYDKMTTGIMAGFFLPLVIGLIIYFFSAHGRTITEYAERILDARILTHSITICVFPNILVFLLFNRYDMLRASRGVLAITIIWAISVFIIKFS